jgi:3-phosphoshikimate 1-carboxyvinyltransferase
MMPFVVEPIRRLKGKISLLGDKSIAHRSIIISSICRGKTQIENFPSNEDCLCTLGAFKKLGIKIIRKGSAKIIVQGKGLLGLSKPKGPIFVGDSGTTLRLLLGVLAGQDFKVRLQAARSLSRRPMLRVTKPLRMMGAVISAAGKTQDTQREEYPPLTIEGGNLKPITYKIPVASAQVKSAILLAGLYTGGITQVIERIKTRDHTERMLKLFEAEIKVNGNKIVIRGNRKLVSPGSIYIPGDISSASFFIVLASILADTQLLIKNVSLNPSRISILKFLKRMGAHIEMHNAQCTMHNFEPMGDLLVKNSPLKATRVKKGEIPSLIDELPIIMVAACFAKGKTILEGVEELRVKETDRIISMSENLKKMGAIIHTNRAGRTENVIIIGTKHLKGARVRSFGDHRTAMSLLIAGLAATGKTSIDDISCINKSFPEFLRVLKAVMY